MKALLTILIMLSAILIISFIVGKFLEIPQYKKERGLFELQAGYNENMKAKFAYITVKKGFNINNYFSSSLYEKQLYRWKDSDQRLDIISMRNATTAEVHEYGNRYIICGSEKTDKVISFTKDSGLHLQVIYYTLPEDMFKKLKASKIINKRYLDEKERRVLLFNKNEYNSAYHYAVGLDSHKFEALNLNKPASEYAYTESLIDKDTYFKFVNWLNEQQ